MLLLSRGKPIHTRLIVLSCGSAHFLVYSKETKIWVGKFSVFSCLDDFIANFIFKKKLNSYSSCSIRPVLKSSILIFDILCLYVLYTSIFVFSLSLILSVCYSISLSLSASQSFYLSMYLSQSTLCVRVDFYSLHTRSRRVRSMSK